MEYNEKQIQIIIATEKLFAEKGFEGTSVRDIAQDAGVNVAMISYYFGSKEKLLEALFIYRISSSIMTLESLLNNKEMDPLQKVDFLVETYVDKMMKNLHFHKITMREQMSTLLDSVRSLVHESKMQNMELVKKLIQEGQRKKVFTKNVDIPLMISTLIGTIYQVLTTQAFHRNLNHMEEVPEEEFLAFMNKKLKTHLKHLFKATLTYEGK